MPLAGNKWLAKRGLYKPRRPDMLGPEFFERKTKTPNSVSSRFEICVWRRFPYVTSPAALSHLCPQSIATKSMRAWNESEIGCLVYRLRAMKVPKAWSSLSTWIPYAYMFKKPHAQAFVFFTLLCIWSIQDWEVRPAKTSGMNWFPVIWIMFGLVFWNLFQCNFYKTLLEFPYIWTQHFIIKFAAQAYQWVELFAGSRAATCAASRAGFKSTCIDIEDFKTYGYSQGPGSPFDILSPSGFASLSQT